MPDYCITNSMCAVLYFISPPRMDSLWCSYLQQFTTGSVSNDPYLEQFKAVFSLRRPVFTTVYDGLRFATTRNYHSLRQLEYTTNYVGLLLTTTCIYRNLRWSAVYDYPYLPQFEVVIGLRPHILGCLLFTTYRIYNTLWRSSVYDKP
jgi:hypothetical protein